MLGNSMCKLEERGALECFATDIISKTTSTRGRNKASKKMIQAGHTKSIVATSLAVVACGLPALGLGSFAIVSCPSSMFIWKTLLYWPSDIFNTRVHDFDPMAKEAICKSAERLKLRYRQASCCFSFQSQRPEVK